MKPVQKRLQAVVDWDWATVGAPLVEVGYCRMDLAMLIGPRAPDLFLAGYEAAAGRRVPHLFFWDLLGALPALPEQLTPVWEALQDRVSRA